MAVSFGEPHLPYEMLVYRLDTMNKKGLHITYTAPRRHPVPYTGNFDAYEGLTFRVFAYTVDVQMPYQLAISSKLKGYATMEILRGQPQGCVMSEKNFLGNEDSKRKGVRLRPQEYFSCGVRAAYNNTRQETFKCLYKDEEINSVTLPWEDVSAREHIHNRATGCISVHISDEVRDATPNSFSLDTLMEIFLSFPLLSDAAYQGKYQRGTGPQRRHVLEPEHSLCSSTRHLLR